MLRRQVVVLPQPRASHRARRGAAHAQQRAGGHGVVVDRPLRVVRCRRGLLVQSGVQVRRGHASAERNKLQPVIVLRWVVAERVVAAAVAQQHSPPPLALVPATAAAATASPHFRNGWER